MREYIYIENVVNDEIWGSDGNEGLIREFTDVIKTGKEPAVTGFDGERVMEVWLTVYKSSISDKVENVEHMFI